MSADNGYIVSFLYNDEDRIGIFYYCASVDEPSSWFTEDHTLLKEDKVSRHVYTDPAEAIIAAHIIERDNCTEYGVSISTSILRRVS